MHIVIVGNGKLSQAIVKRCVKEKISHSFWKETKPLKNSIVLYCGSDRTFKEVADFCKKTKTPLVMFSTNVTIPKKPAFPFHFIPNASAEVRTFIESVSDFANRTKFTKVEIIESHQHDKKDISGTARLIAKNIGKSAKIITSIRDPKKQLSLGIPKKHLGGHAYHKITFTHDGVTTKFEVLVLGRETYAKGAIQIAKELLG